MATPKKPTRADTKAANAKPYRAAAKKALRADSKTAPRKKRTAHNKIDPAKLAAVVERMAEGESLRQICKDPAMPSVGTVIKYAMLKHDEKDPVLLRFAEAYALAKQVRAEAWADELVQIADKTAADKDEVAKARLRVDTRKWLLSKLLRDYADKQRHELSGPDGSAIKSETAVSFYLPRNGREAGDSDE